jgi:hypothetical protein
MARHRPEQLTLPEVVQVPAPERSASLPVTLVRARARSTLDWMLPSGCTRPETLMFGGPPERTVPFSITTG